MKAQQFVLLAILLFSAISCSSRSSSTVAVKDEEEHEALKVFYSSLKEGQKISEVERALFGNRQLLCQGNQPGPQRCEVRFRVKAGDDFGADRLGLQIKNATVRDEYRILNLDFRGGKLLRWESRPEKILR